MTTIEKFNEIENMAKPLMSLLEDKKKWVSHRQEIIDQFRLLKGHLKQLYDNSRSNKQKEITDEFYKHNFIPFIEDAYVGIKTKIGGPPSDKMFSDVYDILDYLNYWKTHA